MNMEMLLPTLKQLPPKQIDWSEVEVVFLGSEGYKLHSYRTSTKLKTESGAVSIKMKDAVKVAAQLLMGPKIRTVVVCDVELRLKDLTLSMKDLVPGTFPRIYDEDDFIGLSK